MEGSRGGGARRRCRIVNAPTGEISDLSPRMMSCLPPSRSAANRRWLQIYCQPTRTGPSVTSTCVIPGSKSPCQPCPRPVRKGRSHRRRSWNATVGTTRERSFIVHHVQKKTTEYFRISLLMPCREPANGSWRRPDGSERSGRKLVLPSHSISYHHPSRSSLPSSTSDGFTTGAKLTPYGGREPPAPRPSTSSRQHHGWYGRCGNARTDSCMSRGHTAQVDDLHSTLGFGQRAHSRETKRAGVVEPPLI